VYYLYKVHKMNAEEVVSVHMYKGLNSKSTGPTFIKFRIVQPYYKLQAEFNFNFSTGEHSMKLKEN
jgi:hypothetical protein